MANATDKSYASLSSIVPFSSETHQQAVLGDEPLVLRTTVEALLRRLRQVVLLDAVDAGSRGHHE